MADLVRVLPDTNVCFPISLLDLVLRCDEAALHRVVWTEGLLQELEEVWVREGARSKESAHSISDLIRSGFPEGEIVREQYADLVEAMSGPDPDDHVHAAAAVSVAPSVLLTANLADVAPGVRGEEVAQPAPSVAIAEHGSIIRAVIDAEVDEMFRVGVFSTGDERTLTDQPIADAEDLRTRICEYLDGTPIPPASLQRLLCGADVHRLVIGADGEVLDAGKDIHVHRPTHRPEGAAAPHIPIGNRGQRRALRFRHARHCAFPGFEAPMDWCEAHHVTEWDPDPTTDHGGTDMANLVPLCRYHHHQVHEGGLTLPSNPTATSTSPDPAHNDVASPPPDPGADPRCGQRETVGPTPDVMPQPRGRRAIHLPQPVGRKVAATTT